RDPTKGGSMRQRLVLVDASLLDGTGAPPAPGREALPYSILRRLSSPSQCHAAPCSAWRQGAPAELPRGAGRAGVSALQERPMKGSFDSTVPVAPLIYRFH